MYIKGTKMIKGVLDLSSIGVQLERGGRFPVTEEQLYDPNVQTALHMGFIVKEGELQASDKIGDPTAAKTDRKVTCLNMHSRPISLKELNREIPPKAEFELKESQLKNAHIKQAINKGMIRVLQIVGSDSDFSETFVKMGDLFEEKQSEGLEAKQKEAEDFVKSLETNEELEVTTKMLEPKVIVDENPAPVKQSEVQDPKRAHVIWNPANNPVINEMKNPEVVEKDKDDPTFIDKKHEQERIDAHPVLKDVEKTDIDETLNIEQNSEVDFLNE